MNLTDLTEVLRDHAELDDTAHDARMAGIRSRVLATRRRLALTGVVCAVLALVGAVYLALPRPVEPAQPTRSFPEYKSGARIVAQAWAELPTDSATVEFTPRSDDFVLFDHCSAELAEQGLVKMLTVNGHPVMASGCDNSGSTSGIDLARVGGAVGKPLEITITVGVGVVEGEPPSEVEDIHPPDSTVTGEFGVGVGEPVPVGEYSFPPRPETLEDIDELAPSSAEDITIRSERNDPDAPQTLDVTWPGPCRLRAALNTPGRLEVLVNGKAVYDMDSWDYGGASGTTFVPADSGPRLSPGQTATITVIPERTTGDWVVQLTEEN
jgi:hypothetical protein